MAKCDYCGQKHNVIFTCNKCEGKYCSKHRHSKNHDCSSVHEESIIDNKIETEENKINDIKTYDLPSIGSNPSLVNKSFNQEQLLENSETNFSTNVKKEYSDTSIEKYANAGARAVINAKQSSLKKKKDIIIKKQKKDTKLELKNTNKHFTSKLGFIYKFLYILVLITSIGLNGYLFLDNENYGLLSGSYSELQNSTLMLQSYYEDLGHQFYELKHEHENVNGKYLALMSANTILENEYNEILNYQKEIQLESLKTITLGPKETFENVYEIPFSGFIQLNYNATDEAHVYVGSTGLDESYYSMNPQYPDAASSLNFTVPVLPDIMIQFVNPNEYEAIDITYSIHFTY